MKTRESDISELQYQVRKALLEPRDKRTVCVDAEVLQHLIDDVNEEDEDVTCYTDKIFELEERIEMKEEELDEMKSTLISIQVLLDGTRE